ncbi:hypothetical protein WJX72_007684 [[Myrmecia] bisecta]|uniref:Alanine--tRNA ligase n=1 Tax=[Myrmecia] bisecta TaxID=41462 RepID=A0AAW1QRR2_9CHLO
MLYQRPATPPKLSGAEIRERFLSFFEQRGHTRLPSSSLVPDDPTVLLTIAGMLQFKPVFLGQEARKLPRATTAQKCVRTNDIENVGVTNRHMVFFEMLGNFSFGDYFKSRAIQMAWELVTQEYKLPAERIWVSVYEDDDEAYSLWRDEVGVPAERIQRMGAEDNFWASGPTGPAGPCSEIYYDFHPERGTSDASLEDDSRFVEIYNLVFMESNRNADGTLTPLAAKNIDTGMGLERVAQILQGVPNNYETDLVFPIVSKAAQLAKLDYAKADKRQKTALKVIGDHVRAVTYLISDSVTPSNIGRGYILRRLIRRVIMKGRLLGIQQAFLPAVAAVAVELSRTCDAAVAANAQRVYDELAREEKQFTTTLEAGEKKLAEFLSAAEAGSKTVSGVDAFVLYDTYGFPLEITQEIAADRGLQVDAEGFGAEMQRQRQRSKDSAKVVDVTAASALNSLAERVGATEFIGYTDLTGPSTVLAILRSGEAVESASVGDSVEVVLDRSPFYAESGGQVGDRGTLVDPEQPSTSGGASTSSIAVRIDDVQKGAGGLLVVHSAHIERGGLRLGQKVHATVDALLRRRIRANHTATHLLQAALKQVLGPDVSQQGSLVTADRLRFDFNLPQGMTADQTARVEALVNGWIQESHEAVTRTLPIAEAKAAGAIAMFGERYGDVVRVVDIPGVSMELCGGTHVTNTSQLAAFRILSEAGIASGIRRIEAVAGPAAVEYLSGVDGIVRSLSTQLNSKPDQLVSRVAGLAEQVKQSQKELAQLKSQLALSQAAALAAKAQALPSGVKLLVSRLDGLDAKSLQDAAIQLRDQLADPAAVVLLSSPEAGKVSIVAAFSPSVVKKGVQAGKMVGGWAKLCGGGGGGRPEVAQAGGRDVSKLPAALEAAQKQLTEALG